MQNASEPAAIIDLPMGIGASKEYMYLQTIHHRPIVEGIAGRTPTETYRYIEGNALLSRWFANAPLNCSEISGAAIQQAYAQLAADGFRYVVVHQPYGIVPGEFSDYLMSAPVYHDSSIIVFAIADLKDIPLCARP